MVSERPDVFMFGEWIYSLPTGAPSVEFANLWGMSLLDFGLCAWPSAVPWAATIPPGSSSSLGANEDMLRLALVLILSGRGIPCL
jgi:cyclomaltodextrin glucanotransferase